MELLANLWLGAQTAMSLTNLFYCLIGCFLGTAIGVLPGLGPVATIAMLLPVTFGLPPVSALIMLSGIYYGAQYGGSTTAILVNLPGESSSVVTALGRLPAGAPGSRRPGAGGRRHRLVLRRHRVHVPDRAVRAAAGGSRVEIRAGRVFLADGAGPRRVDRAGQRLAAARARHDRAGPAAGPGRHRRQFGHRALQLRRAGTGRRHQLRDGGHGRVRPGRDHRQSRARGDAQRADDEGQGTDAHARGLEDDHRADPARNVLGRGAGHPAGRRRDAGVVLGLRAGKEGIEEFRRTSARARSKAWRRRRRPTTPARKRRSFRC